MIRILLIITDRIDLPTIFGCLLFLFSYLIIGCTKNETSNEILPNKPLKVLDIRVFSDYHVVVNGESTSFYLINNYLSEIKIDSITQTRVFFNEEAAKGLMTSLQRFFIDHDIREASIFVFSEEELNQHISQNIYVDVISQDQILFNGKKIHPENLEIALQSTLEPDSTTIYLSNSESDNFDRLISIFRSLGFRDLIVN